MKSLVKTGGVIIAILALAVGAAACGGGGSSSSETGTEAAETSGSGASESAESGDVSIDLGTTTLEVPSGTKPKIGFFAYGLSAYELAYKSELEKMNEEGSDVTWVEAKYDAATQLKQLQTALTTHEYDAWIVEAVDAEGACHMLTEQAPEAEIVVSMIVQPTCERGLEPWGEEVWAPGTLNTVSAVANVTWYTNALEGEMKTLEIGPETKVGVVGGPELSSNYHAFKAALKNAGIEPTEETSGDFTAPTAQKILQGMLSRDPDIEVILDSYEGATPGIIAALKEAGKNPGEVKVGDVGGSSEITVPNVESGWLTASAVYDPKAIARVAIEQIENAYAGQQGPRFLTAEAEGGTVQEPLLVTKENVNTFEPTY